MIVGSDPLFFILIITKSIPKISLLFLSFSSHSKSIKTGSSQFQPVSLLQAEIESDKKYDLASLSKCPVFVIHHLYLPISWQWERLTYFKWVFFISHIGHNKLVKPTYLCVYFERALLLSFYTNLRFLWTTLMLITSIHATHWQFSYVRNKV